MAAVAQALPPRDAEGNVDAQQPLPANEDAIVFFGIIDILQVGACPILTDGLWPCAAWLHCLLGQAAQLHAVDACILPLRSRSLPEAVAEV